jgi:hypothetical protein
MYLTSSPILTPLEKNKDIMLYISATSSVVNAAIVVEREEEGHVYKVQQPVYYISEVLIDSKIRYPHVQKLLYALLITSRKLRHYFGSHKITVITNFFLGDILRNKYATGRISKWAVELGALNIDFSPWKAIKSQSTRRLRGGVDKNPTTRTRYLPRSLENVLRWITQVRWSRCRCSFHITRRKTT